jgi:2OG-Fe(II) oxygenase superfamily
VPVIQLTRQGLGPTGTGADIELLRRDFERDHFLLLKDFLHPDIISLIRPFLERAEYSPAKYKHVGSELRMKPNLAFDTLSFLANDAKLFALVQSITGCDSIGYFQGRVYKLIPNPQHNFDWHDDLSESNRLIAISINLTEEKFRGGVFQIREVPSGKITGQVANAGLGNAVLFGISKDLEHRVTGIEGDTPRISFSGWFKSGAGIHSDAGQSHADSAV